MPMREQSRIKADTVAEECTCSVCHERGCPFPAPAPEPSAPPTGVPVCHRDCGKTYGGTGETQWASSSPVYNTRECAEAEKCLSPPPSDPVTVATGGPGSAHLAPFAHDCGIVSDDEIPTAEEGAETCKRLGIDVPAWAADIRARVAAVATGGVPAGYRLGEGWEVVGGITDWGCSQEIDSDHCNDTPAFVGPAEDISHPAWQAGACSAHAVLMGALVPIDTARSIPPGPVPLEARPSETLTDLLRWQPTAAEVQAAQLPAAPASEPAVRPLSVPQEAIDREVAECRAMERKFPVSRPDHTAVVVALADRLDAARAEAEQLRGKLGSVSNEVLRLTNVVAHQGMEVADARDQATARVRSMRDAAANVARGWRGGGPMTDEIAAAIKRLPLDIGTATGTSREVTKWALQVAEAWLHRSWSGADMAGGSIADLAATIADAIKAAVDKANNRAADAFVRWWNGDDDAPERLEAQLRSGDAAHGAVTPAKGDE